MYIIPMVFINSEKIYSKERVTKIEPATISTKNGAGDEGRTRDNQLGKLELYRLSYARMSLSCQKITQSAFSYKYCFKTGHL